MVVSKRRVGTSTKDGRSEVVTTVSVSSSPRIRELSY